MISPLYMKVTRPTEKFEEVSDITISKNFKVVTGFLFKESIM
jgi:hypothetical protein